MRTIAATSAQARSTSSAFFVPEDFAQRRQVARDDRPARRHGPNSLSGDVNSLEIADAGFGSVTTSASWSRAATSAGGISPVNAIREAQFSRARAP
jgi:hypothetical protein